MFWIILFFLLSLVTTEDSMEKFKLCNNEECILIQCYFPISEFLIATRDEIKPFEHFIELNHVFISYHLCNDLSADNMDEVGACIYGVLFKLYQFDANLTIHQRIHVQQAQIQEESIAVVIDMISKILYRIESIDNIDKLKTLIKKSNEEDIVVINAQSLTPKVHLDISRTILNYGQWFTFIYSTDINDEKTDCLYRIQAFGRGTGSPKCTMENEIQMELERRIAVKKNRLDMVKSIDDLAHINVFKRTLPTLFYIQNSSTFTLISNENIIIIPVNILNFKTKEIERHVFLHGPYPFYLFWSATKNQFQRLGDEPSNELIDILIQDEQEQDLTNIYGMFDDEVRHIADTIDEIEINPNILFLQKQDDYQQIREKYQKSAILFTVKWDSTSKLARRTFHQLASSHLTDYLPMIDIDCFDWTDICNDENIIEWPILLLTENATMTKMYQGSTDENEMALALFRFAVNQPYRIDDDSNPRSVENLLKRQRVVVLARIQYQDKSLYDIYKTLVDMFLNNEHIFFMFQFSTESSCLIIKQKDGDINSLFQSKTTVHTFNEDLSHLKILITNALQISLVPFDPLNFVESTSTTFLVATRSQLAPLNDYFALSISAESPLVWIDTNSPWVLTINQYGHIAYPAVIYIDFLNGHVYVNSTLHDVPTWLTAVRMQSVVPFHELSPSEINEGPSQEGVDFSKQMDDEQSLNEYRIIHEESEKLNEYGLGFDINGLPVELSL